MSGVCAAFPIAGAAQPRPKTLVFRAPGGGGPELEKEFGFSFRDLLATSLARFGFVDGRNLAITIQYARPGSLPAHLEEMKALKPDVVVVFGRAMALRVQEGLAGVPIVAWGLEMPVERGVARSYARPGGRITGITQTREAVLQRQVDALMRMVPQLTGIAVFGLSDTDIKTRADALDPGDVVGRAVVGANLRYRAFASSGAEALSAMPRLRAQGFQAALYWQNPTPLGRATQRLHAETAIRHHIATIGYFAHMADDGLLMSYGELEAEQFLRLAQQVARVLDGVQPAELPIMDTMRFHLRINRATANAMGLEIPRELLILADHVVG